MPEGQEDGTDRAFVGQPVDPAALRKHPVPLGVRRKRRQEPCQASYHNWHHNQPEIYGSL